MTAERKETVIAEGTNGSGDRIELVHRADGTLGIRTAGMFLSFQWPELEIEDAVKEFMRTTTRGRQVA